VVSREQTTPCGRAGSSNDSSQDCRTSTQASKLRPSAIRVSMLPRECTNIVRNETHYLHLLRCVDAATSSLRVRSRLQCRSCMMLKFVRGESCLHSCARCCLPTSAHPDSLEQPDLRHRGGQRCRCSTTDRYEWIGDAVPLLSHHISPTGDITRARLLCRAWYAHIRFEHLATHGH
jgi:hypothetical protein